MVSGLILCDVFLEFFRAVSAFVLISPAWASGSRAFLADCSAAQMAVLRYPFFVQNRRGSRCGRHRFSHHNLQPSNSKCSWRRCGRILGPHLCLLFGSLPMSCEVLSRCINEYPLCKPQYADVQRFREDSSVHPSVVDGRENRGVRLGCRLAPRKNYFIMSVF